MNIIHFNVLTVLINAIWLRICSFNFMKSNFGIAVIREESCRYLSVIAALL